MIIKILFGKQFTGLFAGYCEVSVLQGLWEATFLKSLFHSRMSTPNSSQDCWDRAAHAAALSLHMSLGRLLPRTQRPRSSRPQSVLTISGCIMQSIIIQKCKMYECADKPTFESCFPGTAAPHSRRRFPEREISTLATGGNETPFGRRYGASKLIQHEPSRLLEGKIEKG